MTNKPFWITQIKNRIYITKTKPEDYMSAPAGILVVIQDFTDVSELKDFFKLCDNTPKNIMFTEIQELSEAVVNG